MCACNHTHKKDNTVSVCACSTLYFLLTQKVSITSAGEKMGVKLFHILIASFNPWLYLTSFCIYTGHSCSTKFDLFRLFCFDKPVLITALSAMNNLREDPIEKGSRALRFPGYKQYTRWVQSYLCVCCERNLQKLSFRRR